MRRLVVGLAATAILASLSGCAVAVVAGGAAIAVAAANADGESPAATATPAAAPTVARVPAEPMTPQVKTTHPVATHPATPPSGVTYRLPRVEFDVALTRRLRNCARGGQFELSAVVTPRFVADSGETHAIDPSSFPKDLAGMPLVIDLYDNGTIRRINGGGAEGGDEPQTAPFSGTVQVAGPPPVAGVGAECTEETFRHLEATVIATLSPKHRKVAERSDHRKKDDLRKKDGHRKKADHQPAKVSPARATAYLSHTQHYVFRPLADGSRVASEQWQMALEPDVALMERWFGRATPAMRSALTANVAVHVADWTPSGAGAVDCAAGGTEAAGCPPAPLGIVYRQPASGVMTVCKDMCLGFDGRPLPNVEKMLVSRSVDVPQAGRIGRLPLRTPKSEGKSLVVHFTPAGSLSHLSYTAEDAAARAMIGR
ncbi:MAG: hypothetical protein H7840_15265 [Alphaproteobacteria bacterium]